MLMTKRKNSAEGSWNPFSCFSCTNTLGNSLFSKGVMSLFLRRDECCKEAERFLEAVCDKQ